MKYGKFIKSYVNHSSHIHIMIVPHCNMNCKHCVAVSSLAKPEFASFEQFENSLIFIQKYLDEPPFITITGGDCFLHPHYNEFAVMARNYFKDSYIRIACNGLHLDEITPEIVKTWKDNQISIKIRSYDFDRFYNWWRFGQDNGIEIHNFDHPIDLSIKFAKLKFNKNRTYMGLNNWINCCSYNKCLLIDAVTDRFYKCDRLSGIRHLKSYTRQLIEGKDYYDIRDAKNLDVEPIREIFAMPFCEYCTVVNSSIMTPWSNKGTRKEEEWITDNEFDKSKLYRPGQF